MTFDNEVNNNRNVYYTQQTSGVNSKHYFAGGQQLATRYNNALYYNLSDPTGTSLLMTNSSGEEIGRILYDGYGAILTNTLPLQLANTLPELPDSRTGLVHLGNGRYYDPALGRPLQPNTSGAPPTMPQALNRYTAAAAGQPGVVQAAVASSLPGVLGSNAAANALSYGVAESLGNTYAYDVVTVSRLGNLRLRANERLLNRAGVRGAFTRVPGTGGRGISARYISSLVQEVGEDLFKVVEGPQAGHLIDLAKVRAAGRPGSHWQVRYGAGGPFEVTGYSTSHTPVRVAFNTLLRDFAWNAGIAAVIETPFFVSNVLSDPYLTAQQKAYQGAITGFGILGTAYGTAAIGSAFGNIPGAIAGFIIGLSYQYVIAPYIISPLIYQFRGVDPYNRERNLAPLQ